MQIVSKFLRAVFIIFGVSIAVTASAASGNTPPMEYVKAVYSLPVTFDPIKMNDTASMIFAELIYEGLLRFSPTYSVQPALADSWSTDSTGTVLTFNLRKNAIFHDGSKVTAADVISSFTRAVSPQSKVIKYYDCIKGAAEFYQGKANSVSGLVEVNTSTIEIHLTKPFPPFAYILAGSTAKVLPKLATTKKTFFDNPIGSGPFRYVGTQASGSARDLNLIRFEKYHGQLSLLSKITLRETDEKNARSQAAAGIIHDLSNWPLTGSEEVFKVGQHIEAEVANTWIIGLNGRNSPFGDKKLRQHFKAAVDTEKFRKAFFPGATRAFGYIPPLLPGHKSSIESEANLSKSFKPPKDQITITIPKGLAQESEIIKFLESEYATAGWNVRVLAMDWADMMKRYEAKSLQAFLVAMNVDYPDSEFLLRNFESDNPDNFSGMRDKEFDRLLASARGTQDRLERSKIYRVLADKLNENAYTVNLFHPRAHYWVNKCVRGFTPNLILDSYIDYRKVSLDSKCARNTALVKK